MDNKSLWQLSTLHLQISLKINLVWSAITSLSCSIKTVFHSEFASTLQHPLNSSDCKLNQCFLTPCNSMTSFDYNEFGFHLQKACLTLLTSIFSKSDFLSNICLQNFLLAVLTMALLDFYLSGLWKSSVSFLFTLMIANLKMLITLFSTLSSETEAGIS